MISDCTKILPCSEEVFNEYMAKQWENEARLCETGAATGTSAVHMAAGCRAVAEAYRAGKLS